MTKSAGDNLHYRPPFSKFWGDVSPRPPVIYAHGYYPFTLSSSAMVLVLQNES